VCDKPSDGDATFYIILGIAAAAVAAGAVLLFTELGKKARIAIGGLFSGNDEPSSEQSPSLPPTVDEGEELDAERPSPPILRKPTPSAPVLTVAEQLDELGKLSYEEREQLELHVLAKMSDTELSDFQKYVAGLQGYIETVLSWTDSPLQKVLTALFGGGACGTGNFSLPESGFGVDWEWACVEHDACYLRCTTTKRICDLALVDNIALSCVAQADSEPDVTFCLWLASLSEILLSLPVAQDAWDAGQRRGGCSG
jgi:hypothetical protein